MKTAGSIRNCGIRMRVVCPRAWDGLQKTAQPDVRHCTECKRDVHFCATDAETIAHARAGHCIARARPVLSENGEGIVLRTLGEPAIDSEDVDADTLTWWEDHVDQVIGDVQATTRECPRCRYPVATFRRTCLMCSHGVES